MMYERIGKKTKLLVILLVLCFGAIAFIGSTLHTVFSDRQIPKLEISQNQKALHGQIISKDGFNVVFSQKLYKAMVNTRNIDPDKKELFIKLFSIYSGLDEKSVRERLKVKGNVVLSYSIDENRAKYLKELARKLRLLNVFIPYTDEKGRVIKYGLSLTESGESRVFPYKDILTPVIGFIKKKEDDGFTVPMGAKGLVKFYQRELEPIQDGTTRGKRDIGGTIILNGESFIKPAIDGMNIRINIPIALQKSIEAMIDSFKESLKAKEVTVCIMEAKSGKILSLATSNRYDPSNIRKSDYESLNVSAIEYTYEPGSVIKPITFALLLHENKVNPYDIVRTYGGRYKLGKRVITDEHKEEWMSAENVIVYSSNIGTAQLAQRLDAVEFTEGFREFGFLQKTGIDLPYEHKGVMPHVTKMESEVYKATVAYGYGIRATLMQLVRAYNVFNNSGKLVEPKIASEIVDLYGKVYQVTQSKDPKEVIDQATAAKILKILEKAVTKGTGKNAKVEGIRVGGKTGTAHIAAKKGGYEKMYNSTFIGFANDSKNRYTIGVLVREPKKRYHYFASLSAAPIFKNIVEIMIEHGLLTKKLKD